MEPKKIETILVLPSDEGTEKMNPTLLKNIVPGRFNPFTAICYNRQRYIAPTEEASDETIGFGFNPDNSAKNPNGLQWVTTSAGIPQLCDEQEEWMRDSIYKILELRIKLPARYRRMPARYRVFDRYDFRQVMLPESAGSVEVITGAYNGAKGKALPYSPSHLMQVELRRGGTAMFRFPSGFTTFLIVTSGSIKVNQRISIGTDRLLFFGREGETFRLEGESACSVFIASAEPIYDASETLSEKEEHSTSLQTTF